MSWVAVPTHLHDMPEFRALSSDARALWLAGRTQAGAVESDGFLEDAVMPVLLYRAVVTRAPAALFAELERYGWWQRVDGGWLDLHFLEDGNVSHATRQERRKKTLKRTKDWQERQKQRELDAVKTQPVTQSNGSVDAVKPPVLTLHKQVRGKREQVQVTDSLSPMLTHRPPLSHSESVTMQHGGSSRR